MSMYAMKVLTAATAVWLCAASGALGWQSEAAPDQPATDEQEAAEAPEDRNAQNAEQQDPTPELADDKPRSIAPGPFINPDQINPDNPDLLRLRRQAGDTSDTPYLQDTPGSEPLAIGELREPDPDGVGALSADEQSLPLTAWSGVRRESLIPLMAQVPVGTASPVVNSLGRRIILSPIRLADDTPLMSANGERATGSAGSGLLDARINSLIAAGRVADVTRLVDLTPIERHTLSVKKAQVRSMLVLGDTPGACDVARDANREDTGPYWTRVLALCEAVAGNEIGLDFQVALLEDNNALDNVFLSLLFAVAQDRPIDDGGSLPWDSGQGFDEVDAALAVLTQVQVPAFRVEDSNLTTKLALLRSPTQTTEFRLRLAEDLALHGLVTAADLRDMFGALEFSTTEKASAEQLAAASGDLRTDGLLLRLVSEAEDAATKLRLANMIFDRGRDRGLMVPFAAVLAPDIEGLTPQPVLAPFAPAVIEILLLADRRDAATRWFRLLSSLGETQFPDAGRALVASWPLYAVAQAANGNAVSGSSIIGWTERAFDLQQKKAAAEAPSMDGTGVNASTEANDGDTQPVLPDVPAPDKVLAVLEALGVPVPATAWDFTLSNTSSVTATTPSVALWRRMTIAAQENRVGEGLSAALITVSAESKPWQSHAAALSAALHAMTALGHRQEAAHLAVEALVGGR